jgi:uncharacterized glyoxalase superfamily protein PhnB
MAAEPTIVPFIRYDDAPAALEWLSRAFGFDPRFVVPGPDGTIAHAELAYGSGFVMLGTTKREDGLGIRSARELGAVNQGIYVALEDVDTHHERAVAAGAEVVYGPRDTEYGSREYGARDLEGNLWSFGTYRPGSAATGQ